MGAGRRRGARDAASRSAPPRPPNRTRNVSHLRRRRLRPEPARKKAGKGEGGLAHADVVAVVVGLVAAPQLWRPSTQTHTKTLLALPAHPVDPALRPLPQEERGLRARVPSDHRVSAAGRVQARLGEALSACKAGRGEGGGHASSSSNAHYHAPATARKHARARAPCARACSAACATALSFKKALHAAATASREGQRMTGQSAGGGSSSGGAGASDPSCCPGCECGGGEGVGGWVGWEGGRESGRAGEPSPAPRSPTHPLARAPVVSG